MVMVMDTVTAKVDEKTKRKAAKVLKRSGLTMAEVLRNKVEEIAATGEISVYREPNAETRRSMENIERGRNVKKASSVDDMFNQILGDDWK